MERLIKTGTLPVKSSKEIAFSRVGIGFEKLDRAIFDPEKAYDLVAGIGVKYARIQSGWMRTEKEKGVYDFAWIDSIIDNLLSRGIEPWINLCYGNPLYTENAKLFFGAVGCPPVAGEALEGWLRYVKALTAHVADRVPKIEIWNEPDNAFSWRLDGKLVDATKGTPNGTQYGEFAIATAKAIREANPDAYIIGFGLGHPERVNFVAEAMATGLGDYVDAVSYHRYTTETMQRIRGYEVFERLVHAYNPKIDIIQGESGTQSAYSFAGALKGRRWTKEKQMKHLLRLMVTDLGLDCTFVSYFSAMDMVEALKGLLSDKKSYMDYGFFGVISADFDENGISTGEYTPKPSYYALQNIASLFEGNAVKSRQVYAFKEDTAGFFKDYCGAELLTFDFKLNDGSKLIAYWKDTDIINESYDGTTTVELMADEVPELIDPASGIIYKIPEDMIVKQNKTVTLVHLPLRDYPLMLRYQK